MSVAIAAKAVRESFPESLADQELFVRERLQQRGGYIVYQKLDIRRALCEKFNVRKHDFQSLCIAINRLVKNRQVLREEVEIRPTESYCGYVNPASRQVTLSLPSS